VGLLALAAAAHSAWNAWSLPALLGYDAAGHAGYALAIARDARVPHPLSGWSTFHPPAWHLLAAALWRAVEPLGPDALRVALRAPGALAWLAAGLALHRALRRLGAGADTAWTAAALFYFVPVNQLAVAMIGNEAFAAACAALAIPCLLRLQAEPRDLRAAVGAGLAAGLALATKYSGAWVAAACALPFARRELGRGGRRALAACALAGAAVAGPAYVRALAETGSPFPMTRTREPMRSAEENLVLRERRASDYLWFPFSCLRRPSVQHVAGRPGAFSNRNPAMQSVPCLVYAGLWYDTFAQRVPIEQHADAQWLGPLVTGLGLVPTALLLAGLALAARDLVKSRGRSRDAPLVAMAALAMASFAVFTWRAPSLAAAKASYLMPLAGAAAVFFARGAGALPRRARAAALAASLAAAGVAAWVFTSGALFPPDLARLQVEARVWSRIGEALPGSRIGEAVAILAGPPDTPERDPREPSANFEKRMR